MRFQPSLSGTLSLAGNQFAFTGVEPLVIHGLPDFEVIAPDDPTELTLDAIAVDDLQLENLSLQLVTIDGVVSWTQETKLSISDALEPQYLGSGVRPNGSGDPIVRSGAIALDGTTLVVGGQLNGAAYGVAYVFEWNGNS